MSHMGQAGVELLRRRLSRIEAEVLRVARNIAASRRRREAGPVEVDQAWRSVFAGRYPRPRARPRSIWTGWMRRWQRRR
jgi:hypothetical protein